MMWSAFLSTLFDIISVWADCLVGEYPMGVLILPHILYYLFHIATPFFFCLYVIYLTQQPKIVNKKLMTFIRIPFIVEILLVLTTPFTKWIFTYDNGIYPYQDKPGTWPCRPAAQRGSSPLHTNTSDDRAHSRDIGYASHTYYTMYQKPYGYTCF